MFHQLSSSALVKSGGISAITAASNNGTGIDCRGYTRAAIVWYSLPSGTGTTSDCKLQESTDNSTWGDVSGAAFAQATTANSTRIQVMEVDLSKRSRYLRIVHTGAGGSAAGQQSAVFALLRPMAGAPAQDSTVIRV